MTLLSPSFAACSQENVMFTCNATIQVGILWTITSPMMNYSFRVLNQRDVGIMPLPTTNDGRFTFNVTSYTPSTMELETTVTVTASEDFNGTVLECGTVVSGDRDTAVMTVIGNSFQYEIIFFKLLMDV